MATDAIVGWDIGGAHLKAARVAGDARIERAIQLPCRLWLGMDQLRAAIDRALGELGTAADHAITMTGELADLFVSRAAGVAGILATMAECLPGRRLHIYAGDAGFVDTHAALGKHMKVASANWRATAELVATRIPDAIALDIGSTTTDIVAVAGGQIRARGGDDASRLAAQELLYLGVVRTPLMALARRWPFDGDWTEICNELFATTADIYRLTAELPAQADQHPAADNGPKDIEGSARRLARMIGRDVDSAALAEWMRLADWLKSRQLARTENALIRIASAADVDRSAPIVGAGAGRFLAREIARRAQRTFIDFADLVGCPSGSQWIATCAPAVAVALLALRR